MKFDDVLLALVLRKPLTGYDAKKWLDTEGLFVRANADQSQIYRTLHRLTRTGLIEYTVEDREGAPKAKVYTGTAAGARHLLEVARSPYEPPARWQEPDFLMRFNLLGCFDPPSLIPLIETELAYRRAQVAKYRYRDRAVDLVPTRLPVDRDVAHEIAEAGHHYGAHSTDHWIGWLDGQLVHWRQRLETGGDLRVAAG
jgi:DNA-binding PadR family transcriptional regulator